MILADRARFIAEENLKRRRYNFTHCAMPEIMDMLEKRIVCMSENGGSSTSFLFEPGDVWRFQEKFDCVWDDEQWKEIVDELDKHGYSAASSYVTYGGGVRIVINWKERRP